MSIEATEVCGCMNCGTGPIGCINCGGTGRVAADLPSSPWNDFRRLIRLHRARWNRLEPNADELHAALDKAAAEIIALRAEIKRRNDEREAVCGFLVYQASPSWRAPEAASLLLGMAEAIRAGRHHYPR